MPDPLTAHTLKGIYLIGLCLCDASITGRAKTPKYFGQPWSGHGIRYELTDAGEKPGLPTARCAEVHIGHVRHGHVSLYYSEQYLLSQPLRGIPGAPLPHVI